MPTTVNLPGYNPIEFGDDWSADEINQWVAQNKSLLPDIIGKDVLAPKAPVQSPGLMSSFGSGFKEGFSEGGVPYYSAGKSLFNASLLLAASKRAQGGVASGEDIARINEYNREEAQKEQESAARGTLESIAYGAGRVLGNFPGFAGELATTGGVATAGEKAAIKAAATGIKALGRESAYAATRKAAELASENAAGRILRGTAGALAQTLPASGLRIAAGTAERMTPELDVTPVVGGNMVETTKEGDPFLPAAYKAFGDQFIEVLSERSGGFLEDMLGGAAKKIGLNKLPGVDAISGLKDAVAARLVEKYPALGSVDNVVRDLSKKAGWNGVIGEILEERAGEVGKAAMGVEAYKPPTLEQLATEAVAFGLLGTGARGLEIANAMRTSGKAKNPDIAEALNRAEQILANRPKEEPPVAQQPPPPAAPPAPPEVTPAPPRYASGFSSGQLEAGLSESAGDQSSETSPLDRIMLGVTQARRLSSSELESGLSQAYQTQGVQSIADRLIRANRRSAVEAGMYLPQDSGVPAETPTEQVVGQYPPEGWGTGIIPSAAEMQRRSKRRDEVARRNAALAEEARAKAQAEAAAKAGAEAQAKQNLQPTVSLPTGPGAAAVGGVPAAAPDISQPKTPNANQEQGRVEVPRGNQPQGAPQDAAGQPGAVQEPAGQAVKAVAQAPAEEAKPQLSAADLARNEKIAKANAVWVGMRESDSFEASDIRNLVKYLHGSELISSQQKAEANTFIKSKDLNGALNFVGNMIPKPAVAAVKPAAPAAKKVAAKPQSKSPVAASVATAPVASPAAAAAPAKVAAKPAAKAPAKIKAVKKTEAPAKTPPAAPVAAAPAPAQPAAPVGNDIESKHGRSVAEAVYLSRSSPGTVTYVTAYDDTLIAALTTRDGKTYVRTGIAPNEASPEFPKYTSWTSLLQSGIKSDSRIKDAYKRLDPDTGKWQFIIELKNGYENNGNDVIVSDSRNAAVDALNSGTDLSLKEKGRVDNPSAAEIRRRQLDQAYWSKEAAKRNAKERGYNEDVTKDSIRKKGNHDIVVGKGEVFAPNKVESSGMVIPIKPSLTAPSQQRLSEAPAEPKPAKPLRYEKSENVDIRGNKALVRVGQWVRVLAPAFGNRLKGAGKTGGVYGIVRSVANGVANIYVEKIGVRGKGDSKVIAAGIKPGSNWDVTNGKHLVRIEPQLSDFYPRRIGPELGGKMTGLMIKAENSGILDHYIDTFLAAEGNDSDAIAELKKLRKKYGKDLSLAMESLHYIEDYYDKKRNRSANWYVNPGEDIEEDRKWIGKVYEWMADNMASKERIPFSETRVKRNVAKDLITNRATEKQYIDRTVSDEARVAAPEAAATRMSDSFSPKALKNMANLIGIQMSEADLVWFGGQAKITLSKKELVDNIAMALSGQAKRALPEKSGRQEQLGRGASFARKREAQAKIDVEKQADIKLSSALKSIKQIADQIVTQTYDAYKQRGIEAVIEHVQNGDIVLSGNETALFAASGVITGNQSLSEGTVSLADAINTVLGDLPQNNPRRIIAEKMLQAGVNPKVVVLSDEAFNQLLPGLEEHTAFYDSDPAANTIYVRQSANAHDYLVMHEAIHAATVYALRNNPQFLSEVLALRAAAQQALGDTVYGLTEHGDDFKNAAEFVADAFSNDDFREQLSKISAGQKLSLWDRFKNLIKRLFGASTQSEASILDMITDLSTKQFAPNVATDGQQGGEALFAAERYKNTKEVSDALSVPGLSAEAAAAVKVLASTQSGLIPAATVGALKAAPDDVQRTLGVIQRQYDASATKADISALPRGTASEIERASEAAHGVIKLHRSIQNLTEGISNRLERLSNEITATRPETLSDLADAKNTIAATTAITDTMLGDYQSYLRARKDAGIGTVNALDDEIRDVADVLTKNRNRSNDLQKAVSLIADFIPSAFLASAKSNADVRSYSDKAGVTLEQHLRGKVEDSTISFLLDPSKGGTYKMDGMKRLIPALQLIQKLKSDATAGQQYVKFFEAAWAKLRGTKDRPVSASMMARSYAKLTVEEKAAVDAAKMLSNRIDREDDQLARYTKAMQILEDMQVDPQYMKQVGDAADAINLLEPGVLGVSNPVTGNTTFRINGNDYVFEPRFSPAADAKNKTTRLAAITEIANELATTADPVRRRSLQKMQEYLSLYGGQLGDAALGIGDFDVINRTRVGLPIARPMLDRMFIYRQIPGELGIKLRNLAKVGMSLSAEIQKARENPVYGDFALNKSANDAIQSHPGMDGEKWDKEILNEILASHQASTGVGLEVGDTIPVYGHTVTKEDMAAAKLQARFCDALYRAAKGAERGGILMHHPTLVRETYRVGGEARVQYRNAYASGALTTPRAFDRNSDDDGSIKMAQRWAETKVDGNPAQTLANRIALLNEPSFLNKFIIGHVTEANPEYNQDSSLRKAYEEVAADYRKSGAPATFDEVVNDVAGRLVMISADPYAEVRDKILSEISERTDKYLAKLRADTKSADEDLKSSNLSASALVSIMDSANNFNKPRGEMIMPANFYTHTVSSDAARGALVNGAMFPSRMQQFEAMAQLDKELDNAKRQLEKDLKDAWNKGVREYIKVKYFDGRRSMMKGTAYANYGVLTDLQKQIKTALENYKALISKPLTAGLNESLLSKTLNVLRTSMVANAVPAATNYFSALAAGNFMQHTFLNGFTFKKTGFDVALAPVTGGVGAIWKTAGLLASSNKQLSAWAKANKSTVIPVLRQFARLVDDINRMAPHAAEIGTAPDQMSLRDRAEVVREVGGYGSPVESGGEGGSRMASMIEKAFSKWWAPNVWLGFQGIPSSVDRAANIITLMNIDKALNLVVRSGYKIMENRAATKAPGWDNWNDASNGITADEAAAAGWSAETLTRQKQIFSNIGGLERMLHDYWKRVNAAKAAGTPVADVPPIADPGFYKDVALEMSALTNAPVDSMRPDNTRSRTIASDIYNFIFTFSSWFNGWFSNLGALMAKDAKRGLLSGAGISFMSMALLMALLGSNGAWLNEIRGLFYELVKGRPYPVVRLSDVLRDSSPQSVGKLFGASVALMVPYAGEAVADLLGAQNYRASITDIANLSQSLQLLNNFSSAIKSGVQTGDWTGQMVRLARATVPGSDMVLNRLPAVRGMDAVADAVRVARVNSGELELNPRAGGGAGGMQTHASSLVRQAVAASANGDVDGARKLLEEAAAEKDWKYVQSALRGQNIDVKTFGRQLTPEEKTALLGRMSDSQRAIYQKGEDAINQLANAVPAMSGGGGGGGGVGSRAGGMRTTGGGGMTRISSPFRAFNSKVRELRNKVTPQALRLVKRKISALKPAKLKLPGGRSASAPGSRLLRPVSLGRAGAGRLPGASRRLGVPAFA